MYNNAYIFDGLLSATREVNFSYKWLWKIDETKPICSYSFFIKNTFYCEFGRVLEKDIPWMLMHELAHYISAPEHLKLEDNFGMPRDDQMINIKTGITFSEAEEGEQKVKDAGKFLCKYLNEYEAERFMNFKV